MKQILKSFGIQFAVAICVIATLGVVYAAWNDTVTTGDGLTAAKWNELVANITPSGAIVAFNSTCPTGWTEFTQARGRTILGAGAGAGLSTYSLLDTGGAEDYTLTNTELPSHSHGARIYGTDNAGDSGTPHGNILAGHAGGYHGRSAAGDVLASDSVIVDSTGSGTAFDIRQPYIALTWCEKD